MPNTRTPATPEHPRHCERPSASMRDRSHATNSRIRQCACTVHPCASRFPTCSNTPALQSVVDPLGLRDVTTFVPCTPVFFTHLPPHLQCPQRCSNEIGVLRSQHPIVLSPASYAPRHLHIFPLTGLPRSESSAIFASLYVSGLKLMFSPVDSP